MDFRQLQLEHKEWADRNFPNSKPYQALLGAIEELGELAHAYLKNEQGIRGTEVEHQLEMIDGVGDIIIFLTHFCTLMGMDLDAVIDFTWAQVRERDWTEDPLEGQHG